MAAGRSDTRLRPSLLDRLILPLAWDRGDRGRTIGVTELRDSLQRDLGWLLNTYCPLAGGELDGLPEAQSSNLAYGLSDFSSVSWSDEVQLKAIAREIEEAIRRFEPRLRASSVRVLPIAADKEKIPRELPHFRIEAVLDVDPVTEPVAFDADVDPIASRLSIRGNA
jgi:type VI secretion system protein ImpF